MSRKDQQDFSGEAASLAGRLDKKAMGLRAEKEKPKAQDPVKKKQASQLPPLGTSSSIKHKNPATQNRNILEEKIDDSIIYRPKTKENRLVFEQFLGKLYQLLEDQPQEILHSIADEVLATLKAEGIAEQERKTQVEALVGEKIKPEFFIDLFALSKQITDYQLEEEVPKEEIRAVMLNDEEEQEVDEENNIEHEVQQASEDEQEPEGMDQEESQQQYINQNSNKYIINANLIDAQWLVNELAKYYPKEEAKVLEKQIMPYLKLRSNIECESKLISYFGPDKIELIKLLLKNKSKIHYCTRLAQAQNDKQREVIVEEIKKIPEGEEILAQVSFLKKPKRQQELVKKISSASKIAADDDINFEHIKEQEVGRVAKKVFDLENLYVKDPIYKDNKYKFALPEGSTKIQKPGYEQVIIPAKRVKIEEKLAKIETLPPWMQECFPGVKKFNPVQSKVLNCALNSPKNMLICAPTSSGKTNIAVMAILQTVKQYTAADGTVDTSKFKIVYIAPMKALVAEVTANLSNRLKNLVVKELTGDMSLTKQQINQTQIIVSTPEKWDIITRKAGDRLFTELVKLIIIDEIHLLGDARGPVLEGIIARTIRQVESTQEQVRLVGLSATLPNYHDIATVLRVSTKEGLFYFDSSYRPIPLEQTYIGITQRKGVKKMLLLNEILYDKVIERVSKDIQILVFVHSRRDTVRTAKSLRQMAFAKDQLKHFLKPESQSKKILESIVEKQTINSAELKELLADGIGIHHAGLSRADRDLVEELYAHRHLSILVSTATLAWGVNLPAHTVIIKGTQVYSPEEGKWIELSQQDVFQMMGRAGRPKYDDSGEGIIITGYDELRYYLGLLNTQIPIESQLIKQLPDQLNAQIVLGTVNTLRQAVNWLSYSYLYIRMLRNPKEYGITAQELQEDPQLVRRRVNLCHTAATLLDKNGLIKYDRRANTLSPTALGKIASYYYIKYQSVSIYNENLKPNVGLIELFKIFSMSIEFKLLPIREEEKGQLQKLIETVPVPIKGSADDPTTKVCVLLQAYISRLPLDGYALNSDRVYITQSASRIMRALFEICLRRGWGQATQIALQAAKMVDKCMWSCMNPLRQFKQIPEYVITRLEQKEQFSWEAFYQMTPQEIGQLIKFPKLSKILHKFVHQVPRLDLDAYAQPLTRSCLKIDLKIKADFKWQDEVHGREQPFWLFVLDCDQQHILYSSLVTLKKQQQEILVHFTVPLFEVLHPLYYIKLISNRWICNENCLPLSFRSMILPAKFPQSMELQDIQPFPTSSLGNLAVLMKQLKISYLNQLQSQIFASVVNSTGNVFIGAPAGSGKFTLAVLAIAQTLQSGKKSIVMVPSQECLPSRFKYLVKLFGKKVSYLTGQATKDLTLLASYDIIVTTAESWDVISRRWKSRKGFNMINLFVVEDIHLLAESGSTMEVVVSRMRYISSQMQHPIRMFVMGCSIADFKDVAEWIGATNDHTFNFLPNVRQNPIEIVIQSFEQTIQQSRLHAMQKSLFQHFKNFGRSTLIFVNDRRQAKLTALDFVTLMSTDANPHRFAKLPREQLNMFLKNINDKYLASALEYGIGFIYEGMPVEERDIIEELFRIEGISLLICTYQLRWEISFKSFMVAVIDGTRYEGKENRWVDYTIPEMLQIMSFAAVSEKDRKRGKEFQAAKFYILCQSAKKEFYKKFLFEPYPVESSLNLYLANHMNAQIVAKTLQSKQDCVDWITWSFLYRRLTQNPNYYNLQEVTETGINDYLSELIEVNVEYLSEIKCVEVENDNDLSATNLGIVCSYYYISTSTIATFVEKLTENLKLKSLIELLSEASEFDQIAYRPNQYRLVAQMVQPLQMNPVNKTHALLLLHFSRIPLTPDLLQDAKKVLSTSVRLLHAMVDIISSFGYLKPLILTMQLCQMVVQAMWVNDSRLLQVVDKATSDLLIEKYAIQDVNDFINMEDDQRTEALKGKDMTKIADACNRYPIVSMSSQITEIDEESVTLRISLQRDAELENQAVICPFYPKDKEKEENWWVIVGDKKSNKVLTTKKVTFKNLVQLSLNFEPAADQMQYTVYALCDSYVGCDQADEVDLASVQAEEQADDQE